LTSLDGLQNCTNLQDLYLKGTGVTSPDGLQNCRNLRVVCW
jgi:hypothetical protein